MIKPQGTSGPGRKAARGNVPASKISCHDAKNKSQEQPTDITKGFNDSSTKGFNDSSTKRLNDYGTKRLNDSGKVQDHIVAEKTIRRGQGSSGAKRPPSQRLGNPSDPDAGAAAGENEEEEENEHPEVPQPPRDRGGRDRG
jgi:hypothetical protein